MAMIAELLLLVSSARQFLQKMLLDGPPMGAYFFEKRSARRFITLLLSFVLLSGMMPGTVRSEETRGVRIRPKAPDGQTVKGNHWLFIIGINRYKEWPNLAGPVNDIKGLKKSLLENYDFEPEHVVELKDEAATKGKILKSLSGLMKKLQPMDTLLIYYAGHGNLSDAGVGYWIPHDGGKDKFVQEKWISTSELHGYMSKIKARHVLLIADSCFSGDLIASARGTKTLKIDHEYYRWVFKRMSREIITSGELQPVADTEIDGHSAFAFHLIRELEGNTESWLTPGKVFENIRAGMTRSKSRPLMGVLRNSGHQDGGSYLFFRREKKAENLYSKLLSEAQRVESEALSLNALTDSLKKYEDFLEDVDEENKKEAKAALAATNRIQGTLRGIQLLREGKHAKARAELTAAVRDYEEEEFTHGARQQVQKWQMASHALELAAEGKTDEAARFLKTVPDSSPGDALDEPTTIVFVLRDVIALSRATSAGNFDELFSKREELARLKKSLLVLANQDNSAVPSLKTLAGKKLNAFQTVLQKQIHEWVKKSRKAEETGDFSEQGALLYYTSCLNAADLLNDLGRLDSAAALRKQQASSGLNRSRESLLLLQKPFEEMLKDGKAWLEKEPGSPAAKYWKALLPKVEKLIEVSRLHDSAKNLKEWTKAKADLAMLRLEALKVNVPAGFPRTLDAVQKSLERGIAVVEGIGKWKVPETEKAFTDAKQDLIRQFAQAEELANNKATKLSLAPLQNAVENARKRIVDAGTNLEYGEDLNVLDRAIQVYTLMPEPVVIETAASRGLKKSSNTAVDRICLAIKLVTNVERTLVTQKALELIRAEGKRIYEDEWPRWLKNIESELVKSEGLVQEATDALKLCYAVAGPENRSRLEKAWNQFKLLRPKKSAWKDYGATRISRLWRSIQLAYVFHLYPNPAATGQFLYRSGQAGIEFPMVWASSKDENGRGLFFDQCEVTIRQFRPYWKKDREGKPGFKLWDRQLADIQQHIEKVDVEGLQFPDDWPVVLVSYTDAAEFARWTNLSQEGSKLPRALRRLPTEKEWHRAAFTDQKSGKEWLYPWGNDRKGGKCNVMQTAAGKPIDPWQKAVPSQLFAKGDLSPWGCVGMAGNVSEWVTWRDGANRQGTIGGNFKESLDRASSAYASSRKLIGVRMGEIGFRCVLELPENWDSVDN